MKTVRTRNIFVNFEAHEDGLGRSRISCPPQPFSLQPGEFMRLTLLCFTMQRAWSNVNSSNNTFYWHVPNQGRYRIVIAPGEYATQAALAAAVQAALEQLFNGDVDCEWNETARRLEITIGATMTTMEEGEFLVSPDGFFVAYSNRTGSDDLHDTHHLLGMISSPGIGQEQNGMAGGTTGPGEHVTVLPPLLQTVHALYLRSTMQSETMQTHNFDAGSPDTQDITHSSIVARIPVKSSDEYRDYVRFEENGHLWEVYPLTRQLGHLSFWVTGDKGRNIASLVPGLNRGGILPWNAAFKWEAMVTDLPPKPPPRGGFTGYYHNALTAQT